MVLNKAWARSGSKAASPARPAVKGRSPAERSDEPQTVQQRAVAGLSLEERAQRAAEIPRSARSASMQRDLEEAQAAGWSPLPGTGLPRSAMSAQMEQERRQVQEERRRVQEERPTSYSNPSFQAAVLERAPTVELTDDEWAALTEGERRAVMFNTLLSQAVEKDATADRRLATEAERESYDRTVEQLFGEGTQKYAPNTVQLLSTIGPSHGEDTLDDYLSLQATFRRADLGQGNRGVLMQTSADYDRREQLVSSLAADLEMFFYRNQREPWELAGRSGLDQAIGGTDRSGLDRVLGVAAGSEDPAFAGLLQLIQDPAYAGRWTREQLVQDLLEKGYDPQQFFSYAASRLPTEATDLRAQLGLEG